jgi:hypothetical protein
MDPTKHSILRSTMAPSADRGRFRSGSGKRRWQEAPILAPLLFVPPVVVVAMTAERQWRESTRAAAVNDHLSAAHLVPEHSRQGDPP